MMLLEKYKPKSLKDIIGQGTAITKLKYFINSFPKKRACFIYGPSGIGKTISVQCLAKDLDMELIELDASSLRNKEVIERIVGQASKQASLFGKKKVIFIDELGGLSSSDRGGLTAILSIIKETRFPVIISAIDIWDKKFTSLRFACYTIQFAKISKSAVKMYLEDISNKENILGNIDAIVEACNGDLRSAVIDLETHAGSRDREISIFQFLETVFRSKDLIEVRRSMFNVKNSMEESFIWLSENIPYEFSSPEEIADAYDSLSRADIFLGWVKRKQNWDLLNYAGILSTIGISLSKKGEDKYVQYKRPSRFEMLWKSRSRRGKLKSIASAFSEKCHCSSKKASSYVTLIKNMFKYDKKNAKILANNLGLSALEVTFLKKD